MAAVHLILLLALYNFLSAALTPSQPPPPRVAVFGGTGYIGSRVASLLSSAGCDVVSVSRAECPPQFRVDGVSYLRCDLLGGAEGAKLDLPRRLDAAVSCVGNMRPAPERDGFFGLHWNDTVMEWENGLVNERVALAAKEAGARRFAYISVSGLSVYALGGGLEVSMGWAEDAKGGRGLHTSPYRVRIVPSHTDPRRDSCEGSSGGRGQ